jgi:hypothetical protein
MNGGKGQLEHYVVSGVAKFIPESVRTQWNEWRQSLKGEEKSHLGSNEISDKVEMVGWGVEQAQERNKEEASKFGRKKKKTRYPSPCDKLSLITSECLRQLRVMGSICPAGIHGL